jgi:hypothetical protein
MKKKLLAGLFLFNSLGCSNKCQCFIENGPSSIYLDGGYQLVEKDRLDLRQLRLEIEGKPVNPYFDFFFLTIGEDPYFLYVSKDHQLRILSLKDSAFTRNFPITNFSLKQTLFAVAYENEGVHLVDLKNKIYHRANFSSRGTLDFINKIDFSSSLEKHEFIKSSSTGKKVWSGDSTLIMSLGSSIGKNSLSKEISLSLDLRSEEAKKMLAFPDCYQGCEVYNERPVFSISKNKVFCLLTYYDRVYKYQMEGNLVKAIAIPASHGVVAYDRKKEKNHAYTREYDAQSEKNVNLIQLNEGSYVVFQKLPQESVVERLKYRFVLFSQNDLPIAQGSLKENVVAELAIPFKKGFLIPNIDLNAAFYYEFDK